MPRLEGILNYCLNKTGISTSYINSNSNQRPVVIKEILKKAYENKLIDEDTHFFIDAIFLNDEIPELIVRHNIAHGTFTDKYIADNPRLLVAARFILWLAYHLVQSESKGPNK